jgi:isochorismate hydrolase
MVGIPPIEAYHMPTPGDLPRNVSHWEADPRRAVLLLHDMQRYFLRPVPPAPRDDLITNATILRKRCTALEVPVAYTAQPGGMTEEERGLLKDFWGPGMRIDPADREVASELAPSPEDWLLTKWRYSAFFRSGLRDRMRDAGRDQLIVCGVYAHVGVLMTAVDAFTNDIEVFLAADAVADFSLEWHQMALQYAARCCAVVTPAGEVLA